MLQRANGLVTHPAPYVVWAALVVGALWPTSLYEPYVFGFTTLGLAWLTGAIALAGLATCLIAKKPLRDCAIIVAALATATAAIAKALATLKTFNWP